MHVCIMLWLDNYVPILEQAKPETVEKVCDIVRKQLALPEGSEINGESKFAALGADSLDTVFDIWQLSISTHP